MASNNRQFRGWVWLAAGAIVVAGVTAVPAAPATERITYQEARPILEALRDQLPPALKTQTPAGLESAWPQWTRDHDAEVRARLARGDEDSVVNFWMYGT